MLYEKKTTIELVLVSKKKHWVTLWEADVKLLNDESLDSQFRRSSTEDVENKLEKIVFDMTEETVRNQDQRRFLVLMYLQK